MNVLDASFVLSLIFDEVHSKKAESYLNLINESENVVPSHWSVEVTNGLSKAIINNSFSEIESYLFLTNLSSFNIQTATNPSAARILKFSLTHNLSTYDAAYLLLAQDLGATLFTFDEKLIKKAESLKVECIS